MIKDSTPDAAESSAGDDFHILWAIQKSLKLINFEKEGLKAIAIENLSKEDLSYFDSSGGMSLGVDLTEYYGGLNFNEAEKVIVSQLKYSTRTPTKDWTAARICTSSKGNSEGSIINRLALFYSKLSAQIDRETVLRKLTIKLVSNRPASKRLIDVITSVKKDFKRKHPKALGINTINKSLTQSQQKELDRLFVASRLSVSDFVDFISVIDFSDCDEGSRFEIEQNVILTIASMTSFKSSGEHTYLHKLIWSKMLPEQRTNNTISLPDVLLAFSLYDISAIFPVKNEIEAPTDLVNRSQLSPIVNEILDTENGFICLHGGAGIGKSTFVGMIPDVLPNHSVSIIFDCYGGGSYLDPDDRRHTHIAGITQLCNELSLATGSNLLLQTTGTDEFYLKQFKDRINAALLIIRNLNPDAILAIILDASDNSVTAAELLDDRPFVKDILQMKFPEGCKIIVTARTERVDKLELPSETKKIKLQPFTLEETAAFLIKKFEKVSEEQVNEFRKLTKSVPRVMAYALELPGESLSQKMMPLKPNGKTLDQIFRIRIKDAERKSSRKDVTNFLKNLIALPRPIPYIFLKNTTLLSDENLSDIRVDLWREVVENQEEFTFRDEDFETYLRTTYKLTNIDYDNIANAFLAHAKLDGYASTHLANFLNKAGKSTELIEIVIERKFLEYPLDPVKNKEVFIDRTKLAMKNALVDFNPQIFIKLQVVAAEAAKTNKVLEDILLERPELSAKYGNLQTNQKIYFQSGNPGWFGPIHYRNAAIYSRQHETIDLAKQHLNKAKEWVDYRRNLEEDESEKYKLEALDLAFGAEAIINIYGPENAVEWIKDWKPKQALYHVADILIKNLIASGNTQQIDKWLKINDNNLRIDLRLLIVRIYFLFGRKPPLNIGRMLEDIQPFYRNKLKCENHLMSAIMAFCEYCLKTGIQYDKVKPVLSLIETPIPNHAPRFYSTEESELLNLDLLIRKGIIQSFFEKISFVSRNFYPKNIQNEVDSNDYNLKTKAEDQVKRFERLYAYLLPAYEIRANYFFKNHPSTSHSEKFTLLLNKLANDWELTHYHRVDTPGLQKFIILKLLDISFHQRNDAFIGIIKTNIFHGNLKDIDLLLQICEKLSKKKRFSGYVLEILDHLEGIVDNANLSGRELVENYTRAAVVGSECSLEVGKYFFDKMVVSSSEIDLEAFDQIRSIRDFTLNQPPLNNPDLAVKFFRYSEYCADRLKSWDGYPWYAVIPALAKLDIRTAFAGVCQWDHRYVKSTDNFYLELIHSSLEQGFISIEIGTAFLAMNKHYYDDLLSYYQILFEKIDLIKDFNLKNEALRQIIRDIKLNRPSINNFSFVEEFLNLIKSGKFSDKEIILEFKYYINGLKLIIPTEDNPVSNERKQKHKNESYRTLIQKHKKVDALIFKNLTKSIEANGSQVNYKILFKEISNFVDKEQYLEFLEAIVDIKELGVCYNDFICGLKIFLTTWKKDTKVKEWRSTSYEKIVKKWFSIFFYNDHINVSSLKQLAHTLEVDDTKYAMSLVKIISEKLENISSSVLYQTMFVVEPLIKLENREEILSWMLSRWVERVPHDFSITNFDGILTNGTSSEVVAYFIRYNLGHPKKKIRWLAAHMLRRLALFKNGDVLKILLDLQNQHTCHPFQDQNYTFYWISAKLYLWITIERISKESPEVLAELSSYVITEIHNKDLPHALIRYFVQSAGKALISYNSNIFSPTEREEINNALSSPFELNNIGNIDYSKKRKSANLSFDFDTLDTLPYWYDPLGRLFNVDQYAVAVIADKFIQEHWGYVGSIHKDNHVKNLDNYDTSNNHGSEPATENLNIYYEYHSMFCAATTLLHTRKLTGTEDSWDQTWQQWIEGWALCWKNFWLSDLNDPTPLIKKYWINNRRGRPEWEWEIGHQDFENLLGLDDETSIVVYLRSTVYYGKDYESLSLTSGLVNPSTSGALLRMFQTRNPRDNYILLESDHDHSSTNSLRKTFPQFQIESWLFAEKSEISGIDKNDPFFKDNSTNRVRPGASFIKWSNCKNTSDSKYFYSENEGVESWVTEFLSWSTLNERPIYSDFSSNGVMLKFKRETLKSYLTHLEKDLIVITEISRRVDRKDHVFYPPYNKVYLIKANGTIETLSGNYSSW